MGVIGLAGRVIDEDILLRNDLFVPEVKKVLDPFKGKIVLVQGFSLGDISLQMGEYFTLRDYKEDKKYCLVLSSKNITFWFNQGVFSNRLNEGEGGIPFNYNGCSVSRIVGPSRELIYSDSESINDWDKKFNEWDTLGSFEKHQQKEILRDLLKLYGIEINRK
jgi:hypothetical protein